MILQGTSIWVFPRIGESQNGWWKSWKTLLKWDDLGVLLFLETSIWLVVSTHHLFLAIVRDRAPGRERWISESGVFSCKSNGALPRHKGLVKGLIRPSLSLNNLLIRPYFLGGAWYGRVVILRLPWFLSNRGQGDQLLIWKKTMEFWFLGLSDSEVTWDIIELNICVASQGFLLGEASQVNKGKKGSLLFWCTPPEV